MLFRGPGAVVCKCLRKLRNTDDFFFANRYLECTAVWEVISLICETV